MLKVLEIIRVLIADDELFFIETLEEYLSAFEGIVVVATARNEAQALEALSENSVDVVLCDVRMPIVDGIEFSKAVLEREINCKIIAWTSFNDDRAVLEMLRLGASGFLLKSSEPSKIVEAIRKASIGGTTIDALSATKLRKYLGRFVSYPEDLPRRERDVLDLLHLGKSNDAISKELDISMVAVKKAVRRLMERYCASSRLELVAVTRNL